MNLDGIARPYAKAVFEIAKENNELSLWLDSVETLSSLVACKDFQSFVHSPNTSKSQITTFVMSVLNKTPKSFQSFVEVLIDNNRLISAPSIYSQLIKAISLDAKVRQAEISVAEEIDKTELKKITGALEKRYDCKVETRVTVDSKVVGGAVIKMDDNTVFDGSLATRLDKLEYLLSN